MAANDHLSEYQFRYRPTGPQTHYPRGLMFQGYFADSEEMEKNGHSLYDHEVEAIHKPTKMVVGEMLYHDDGPLFMIDVAKGHQRKGVAEGMLKHAVGIHKRRKKEHPGEWIPHPSRSYSETDAGRLWAESMVKRGLLEDNR